MERNAGGGMRMNYIHLVTGGLLIFSNKYTKYPRWGIKSKWYCSQDSEHRRASKKVKDETKKNRDRLPMQTFDCRSNLRLRVIHQDNNMCRIHVQLTHHATHRGYYDITLPSEARNFIAQNKWSTPADIARRIRANKDWDHIKTYQVKHVWKQLCQDCWRLCEDQVESAKQLLEKHGDRVELFDMESVPDVTALAFGVTGVGSKLKSVVEVAMDATCKSNYI
jgi:hypothetical protein